MNRYTLYCTPEQTEKASNLGAPIKCFPIQLAPSNIPTVEKQLQSGKWIKFACPTAEEMIGWLEEQGMFIEINFHQPDRICSDWKKTIYTFCVADKFMVIYNHGGYNDCEHYPSRKEAILAAIDAALDYLIKNKNK